MKPISMLRILAAFVVALVCSAVEASGPLGVCYGVPTKYAGAGNVALNYDQGALGTRSKATADTLVTSAVSLWTNVPTATVSLSRGADLPVDVTSSNYLSYWNSFSDGLNPVIYDSTGSIINAIFGAGANTQVLGVAGSAWNDSGSLCQYNEGRAVINGCLADSTGACRIVSDTTMSNVITHEVGHLIGMDHTEVDGGMGLATSNYPMMYPIAYRTSTTLHEDDVAGVSALYPDSTVNSAYGQLTGTFTQVNGTPIQGANIWAQGSGGTFSVVSDYLIQGTGYFKLLLPPGTYTLHASAINASFTGGSSVGPFSEASADASFQAPLYNGGVPMSSLTLGGGSPTQITITAGCSATVGFRFDGTGTVGGNCGATAPSTASAITSPAPGSTLTSSTVTFSWTVGTGVSDRYLMVGTTLGGSNIYAGYQGSASSRTVTGLPTNSSTVYVRLMSYVSSGWQINDYTYTAASSAGTPTPTPTPTGPASAITSPAPGSTLTSSTVTFSWTAGAGVADRYLMVGTTLGGSNIYAGYQGSASSHTVGGLPTNSSTVYVRLMSYISGAWQINDYTYTAASSAGTTPTPAPTGPASAITSPAPGSTLTSSSVTFSWTAGTGVADRYLMVGTTFGGSNIYVGYQGNASSRTVTGLPTNGATVYVRLMSYISGAWQINDYTYTAVTQ